MKFLTLYELKVLNVISDSSGQSPIELLLGADMTVFSKVVHCGKVYVRLLTAKSRVALLQKLSFPRLGHIVATIGIRLYTHVVKSLKIS